MSISRDDYDCIDPSSLVELTRYVEMAGLLDVGVALPAQDEQEFLVLLQSHTVTVRHGQDIHCGMEWEFRPSLDNSVLNLMDYEEDYTQYYGLQNDGQRLR
ncbi:hypothetical protein RvY_11172 [Ramazzottius varieornatus]|uniref:Uncharacterized protein n=1 Tax=Ramazzottius varieornatus TaxID=947166 RepID=A0A1D1VN09_RAMVA|nr:hypothetical protein RvY_11172 [Ramazzottius varieornatus]